MSGRILTGLANDRWLPKMYFTQLRAPLVQDFAGGLSYIIEWSRDNHPLCWFLKSAQLLFLI